MTKNKPNKLLAVIFMANALLVFQGCTKDSNVRSAEKAFEINQSVPIHLIVPVGFRGKIQITEDKKNGVVPSVKGGTVILAIPTNGCVAVKNWEFLFTEHHESASYADGTPIPDPNMTPVGQGFPPDEVGYWALGTEMGTSHPKETVIYFVGTKEELEKLK